MTKCLLKALKAVDLDKHVELFRALGYESAGALAYFRTEHFEKLNFTETELLHLISLVDVLKEATRDGKICSHYFQPNKQQSNVKSVTTVRASWCDESSPRRSSQSAMKRPSSRSKSSTDVLRRSSAQPVKSQLEQFIPQKPSTAIQHEHFSIPSKTGNENGSGAKSFLNRPVVEHVKVKSYNYGVPTSRRSRSHPPRVTYQHELNSRHGSVFASSLHHNTETISYAKPAEIYVYARKRPLLSSEKTFEDTIAVPDHQRVIIAENKANLDCTPLLKKTEFQFDQVFGSDASNKQVFESTVLPFISTDHRHNLTYICFGQTGSGKSHTIFGSRNTDGLLIYCTQLLLREVDDDNKLSCSFYEIYNNQVYDLVNGGKRLFVREDGEHHVNVIGLTEFLLKNLDNLRCVIDEGLARRHHGKSAFNSNSSRSHAVFQITLHHSEDAAENFRLIFIDLAGSERATDAQNNLRQTRREGAQINWSLLALKECIRSMDLTHSHAPFRQSKLTHILRDSLVGSKTRTCLMANVSPPSDCCQCSLNTLQYASRIRDISIRHRHRTMVSASVHVPSADDTLKDEEMIAPEKPQRTFKPATASTPVQRLIASVDSHFSRPTGTDTRRAKHLDIDWQIADDDIPIAGGGNSRLIKSLASSKRDFKLSLHTNGTLRTNQRHANRLHDKKANDFAQSPSSYFPMPQSNIEKPSHNKTSKETRLYDSTRLMYDDGNERRWKPTPTLLAQRLSGASIEALISNRAVPVVPMQTSEEQLAGSASATESLHAKISKTATGSRRHRKSSTYNGLVESLDLNKHYDTANGEPLIYSDRQATFRDQTGFFTNRDELLSIVSSRLTSASQRSSATPKKTNASSRSNISHPSQLNKPKNVFTSSSSSRTHQKSRSTKPSTSLATKNQPKKLSVDEKKAKIAALLDPTTEQSSTRYQRSTLFRGHQSSDSGDDGEEEKVRHSIPRREAYSSKSTAYLTRSEGCQTTDGQDVMKNEQEQTDHYLFSHPVQEQKPMTENTEPLSLFLAPPSTALQGSLFSPVLKSNVTTQLPLDQTKVSLDRPATKPISPVPSRNIDNPWTLSSSFGSPSKDFAVRVSDQLNALRSLLETHLVEPTQTKQSTKDSSERPLSPSTFAREFLKSCRQSSLRTSTMDLLSDDDDREVASSFGKTDIHVKISSPPAPSNQYGFLLKHHYEQIIQPSLSSFSDKLTQAKVSLSDAAKLETQAPQDLPADTPPHQPSNENHGATVTNASNPTSDSDRTSQGYSTEQNPFAGTSSDGLNANRSLTHSPFVLPPFSTFDTTSRIDADQGESLDQAKGSSLLSTSPFHTLLNSLKSMREKDLDFAVHNGDDQLIPVAD